MKKIVYLLVIGLIFTLPGCGLEAPKVNPKNEPNISEDEFDQIKNGMTYEQVTAIVGGPGEVVFEAGTPGDQFYTVKYQFGGEGFIGSNAQLMFQGGTFKHKGSNGIKIKNEITQKGHSN